MSIGACLLNKIFHFAATNLYKFVEDHQIGNQVDKFQLVFSHMYMNQWYFGIHYLLHNQQFLKDTHQYLNQNFK